MIAGYDHKSEDVFSKDDSVKLEAWKLGKGLSELERLGEIIKVETGAFHSYIVYRNIIELYSETGEKIKVKGNFLYKEIGEKIEIYIAR